MVLDKGSIVVLGMNINRFGTGVRRLGNTFGTSARGASLNEIVTTGVGDVLICGSKVLFTLLLFFSRHSCLLMNDCLTLDVIRRLTTSV